MKYKDPLIDQFLSYKSLRSCFSTFRQLRFTATVISSNALISACGVREKWQSLRFKISWWRELPTIFEHPPVDILFSAWFCHVYPHYRDQCCWKKSCGLLPCCVQNSLSVWPTEDPACCDLQTLQLFVKASLEHFPIRDYPAQYH